MITHRLRWSTPTLQCNSFNNEFHQKQNENQLQFKGRKLRTQIVIKMLHWVSFTIHKQFPIWYFFVTKPSSEIRIGLLKEATIVHTFFYKNGDDFGFFKTINPLDFLHFRQLHFARNVRKNTDYEYGQSIPNRKVLAIDITLNLMMSNQLNKNNCIER